MLYIIQIGDCRDVVEKKVLYHTELRIVVM